MKSALQADVDAGASSFRLLALLVKANCPLSLDDIARESGTSVQSAQQALRSLETEGFIIPGAKGDHFVVGPKFIHLAKMTRENHFLEQDVRPIMQELAGSTGETVTLNTYTRGADHSVCIMVEDSPAILHYAMEVGEMKPLHAGATGRSILARLSDSDIQDYIDRTGLPAITPKTITDPKTFWRELNRVRKHGYAISRGQRLDGTVAIAAPVFDAKGDIFGSLVMNSPSYRYETSQEEQTVAKVRHAAGRITEMIESLDQ